MSAVGSAKAEHVVLIVWDGLRPDCINERDTPALAQFVKQGVFFQAHHAVYLSSTEVNAAALATGDYPERNGILGNREYRPEIDPLAQVEVDSAYVVRKGDELTGGHYLPVPTMAELVRGAGADVALVGNKPVPRLFDRHDPNGNGHDCASLMATLSAHAIKRIAQSNQTAANDDTPQGHLDTMAARALVYGLWDERVPKLSVLWLSEPDITEHQTGPSSATTRAALRNSDRNLALVLAALSARGLREKTDVLVVSDHGFSTIGRTVPVVEALRRAGFQAVMEFTSSPVPGQVIVVNEGGSVLVYVIGHSDALVRALATFFQQQDFTGVIFTRQPMPGTFTFDQARINTPHAPDLVVSMKWSADRNAAGLPGMLVTDGAGNAAVVRGGAHGSLSRFEMHNTLVAAGPDFLVNATDDLPTGNADVAPTILSILGVRAPQPMDGRVLAEAMRDAPDKLPAPQTRTLESTGNNGKSIWRQSLRVTEYGGAVYLDEGNGSVTGK